MDREDMLALTRRMTPKRTSFTRIAGSYMDADGEIDGTFNVNFLNLPTEEKEKNLSIAKAIPISETNVQLKTYRFPEEAMGNGSVWQLLMGLRACALKNDALMDTFYELIGERYRTTEEYAVYVFHDSYDIPAKGTDKVRQGESEETFEYLICAICPLVGEYEPGKPECGFLFPSFSKGSGSLNEIAIFQADVRHPHLELIEILGCKNTPI